MRIISRFRDYYDFLFDGSDPRSRVRRTEVVPAEDIPPYHHESYLFSRYGLCRFQWWKYEREPRGLEIDFMLLAFCGELFPVWYIDDKLRRRDIFAKPGIA